MDTAASYYIFVLKLCSDFLQAVVAISDVRNEVPIHLELASMTDRDYMNRILQEVNV